MEFRIRKDTPVKPHRKHWQFCVGSGHALLALRTDYTRQLKWIHDTLGIQRVRFHGIFDDDMRTFNDLSMMYSIPGSEAFTEYNFNACGVAYDNVLEAGMKPFVELSFMPDKLARKREGEKREGSFFYHPLIVPPEDLAAWKEYITAFMSFLIHRYGIEEIRTWYFEVWNEPDLPMAFWNGTRDEYFALYEATAQAIKAVDAAIPVGGPATSNSKWVRSFLQYCRERSVPVDFVSTHQYAGDPLGGVEAQGGMEETDQGFDLEAMMAGMRQAAAEMAKLEDKTFLKGFRTLMPDKSETTEIEYGLFPDNAKIVRQQAEGKPVFYTEWNENAGFSAYTNDTRKVAAYDVRAALEVEESVDGSSIWCFSDIFEELHPFPQEFHGGFGMLSQNGIPKPVYHAMKMLSDAGDQRMDLGEEATKGEIGIAAFRKGKDTQVILFRQKMKNMDLPKEKAVVRLELAQKPARVLLRRVDEEHGNPLRLWEEMGSPVSLNRQEVEALKRESAVEREACEFDWTDGTLTLAAELGVNDVYFFEIEM
ncbi:MAG: hypothetical protein IKE24_02645 [Clostridia bacterium]|nr:hypothetical protein [Clostridia bacterium]